MSHPVEPLVEPARPPARLGLRDHLDDLRGGVGGLGPRLIGVGVTVVAVAAAALLLWPRSASPSPELALPQASTTVAHGGAPAVTTSTVTALVVDVVGEVRRPGVVRVAGGARITDVIDAAGGLTDRADRARLNLAAPVVDGERVFVPAVGQQVPPVAVGAQPSAAVPGGGATPSGGTAAAPVNINTASLAELETLPGVGPATAQAIIDHRTQHGPFTAVDDLLDVRGIGDAKLADLRDQVVV